MSAEMFDKDAQRMLKEIYTGAAKCRVETEILLPDYKEEVSRIIRVDVKPRITNKNTYTQGQFVFCELDGVAVFNILYLTDRRGENGAVTSHSTQEEFHHVFKLPKASDSADFDSFLAFTELFPENTVAKLLGPRKITMRSDIDVSLSLKGNQDVSFYSDALPQDMQVKTREGKIVFLQARVEQDFHFTESITLPKEYMAIGEILDMDISLFAEKPVVSAGRLNFSGQCNIFCSYASADEESLVSFYQPIEFEQNMEFEDADEDSLCEIHLIPNLLKATPDLNEDGENKVIRLEIGYTAEAAGFCNATVPACEDVYSVSNELKTAREETGFEYIASIFDSVSEMRGDFHLKQEGIMRAEGIKALVDFRDSYFEEENLAVECKLHLHFVGVREDGTLSGVDEALDFKILLKPDQMADLNCPQNLVRVEICGGAKSCDIDINEGEASVRCEIFEHIKIFCREDFEIISEISKLEPLPARGRDMIFYYPNENEALWDVAKKYKTPLAKLRYDNSLDNDEVPRVMRIL